MTQFDVHFDHGRDLLNAYWGYLAGGGLTVNRRSTAELQRGQAVELSVHIGADRLLTLSGHIAHLSGSQAVIAFDTDDTDDTADAQTRLLSAALCERSLDVEARLAVRERDAVLTRARLSELGEEGCRISLHPEHGASFAVGTEVVLEVALGSDEVRISGCVIAASSTERCIAFGLSDPSAASAVRAMLGASARAA